MPRMCVLSGRIRGGVWEVKAVAAYDKRHVHDYNGPETVEKQPENGRVRVIRCPECGEVLRWERTVPIR